MPSRCPGSSFLLSVRFKYLQGWTKDSLLIRDRCDLTKEEELNRTFNQIYQELHHVDGM